MSTVGVRGEATSENDGWRKAFWILFLASTIAMLSYEYAWSRFALHSLATITFGGWFWATLAIATPWSLCLICLKQLREAVRNGKLGRDVCPEISVWVAMIMLAAYLFLVPAVHRLPSLGALQ